MHTYKIIYHNIFIYLICLSVVSIYFIGLIAFLAASPVLETKTDKFEQHFTSLIALKLLTKRRHLLYLVISPFLQIMPPIRSCSHISGEHVKKFFDLVECC